MCSALVAAAAAVTIMVAEAVAATQKLRRKLLRQIQTMPSLWELAELERQIIIQMVEEEGHHLLLESLRMVELVEVLIMGQIIAMAALEALAEAVVQAEPVVLAAQTVATVEEHLVRHLMGLVVKAREQRPKNLEKAQEHCMLPAARAVMARQGLQIREMAAVEHHINPQPPMLAAPVS